MIYEVNIAVLATQNCLSKGLGLQCSYIPPSGSGLIFLKYLRLLSFLTQPFHIFLKSYLNRWVAFEDASLLYCLSQQGMKLIIVTQAVFTDCTVHHGAAETESGKLLKATPSTLKSPLLPGNLDMWKTLLKYTPMNWQWQTTVSWTKRPHQERHVHIYRTSSDVLYILLQKIS